MLRRTRENFFSLIVIFIITTMFLYYSLQLEFFESKIMPIFIGVITIILLIISLYNEYTKMGCETLSEDNNSSEDISANDIKTIKCILPLFVLVALIYIVGFYASTLIFTFLYMKLSGSSLVSSILVSGAGTIFIYVVFPILLETPLYTGLLMQYFSLPF